MIEEFKEGRNSGDGRVHLIKQDGHFEAQSLDRSRHRTNLSAAPE
jgi:hypothetical protein